MKAQLVYRKDSETERLARDFAADFERMTGKQLEIIEADAPEGIELCKLYGIVSYPAVLARTDEGQLLQLWQGEPLPRIGEVSFYAQ